MRTQSALLAAICLCFPLMACAGQGDGWSSTPVMPPAFAVQSGSAPIEQALSQIIPQPYAIKMDASIPKDWIVHWSSGQDWMTVLRQALAPMGLRVVPQWSQNTILIDRDRSVMQAPSAPDPKIHGRDVAAQQGGVLMGATGWEWDQPAPTPPAHPVSIASAVMRLLPPSLKDADLAMTGFDTSKPVIWAAGQTRREALGKILADHGLTAVINGSSVRISRAAAPTDTDRPVAVAYPVQAVPVVSGLSLQPGHPLGEQLRSQGQAQGWTVVWNVSRDWIVPSSTQIGGDFQTAATKAIEAAAAEGAPIAAAIYPANRTIVVSQTGVSNK